MSDNKNRDFNIEQISDVYAELSSGNDVVNDLIDIIEKYEELLATTKTDITGTGAVTSDIQNKIDKNVKYVMNQIDSIMKAPIVLRKTTTKKMNILAKLSRGIKYSYKLANDMHVMGPVAMKFDLIEVDTTNNIITVGNKTYQLSTKDDYNSGIMEISDISDISDQFSDDDDELPNIDDDDLPEDGDHEDLEDLVDPLNKYDALLSKLVDAVNIAYKMSNYYCHIDDSVFDSYFGDIVVKIVRLSTLLAESTPSIISEEIYQLDKLVKDSSRDFDINHDFEDCQRFGPIFQTLDYHLDKTQKSIQQSLYEQVTDYSDMYDKYIKDLDKEIIKSRTIKTLLDLSKESISYIVNTIKDDVLHFNLFEKNILTKLTL